jgi:hypothetical protein
MQAHRRIIDDHASVVLDPQISLDSRLLLLLLLPGRGLGLSLSLSLVVLRTGFRELVEAFVPILRSCSNTFNL